MCVLELGVIALEKVETENLIFIYHLNFHSKTLI